jgi:acetoin:2,6-dichlorophenolindophenol oxidoreductase subunit beta
MPKMRMRQAIARAIADEMADDPRVVLLGEDVAAAGGVFKTSEGLLDRFGPDRVKDTPIAEMGFLGAAVGAATAGLRPVVEIMFAEFLGVALDQLVTEAANLRYLSRGEYTVPLVVRASAGPGLGFGAQHSQTLESWLIGTPGLKVVSPSGADSAYGLLRAAIRDDDPVVFLEPRVLYGQREDVDTEREELPELGRARVARPGRDVTVVAIDQPVRPGVRTALCAAYRPARGGRGRPVDGRLGRRRRGGRGRSRVRRAAGAGAAHHMPRRSCALLPGTRIALCT